MTEQAKSIETLKHYLSNLSPLKVVGVGGLAIFCAASLVAFVPVAGAVTTYAALAAWISGLGLNISAGLIQQLYQIIYNLPSKDKTEQITQLAQEIAKEIQARPNLRGEIGIFLEQENVFQVAQEIVQSDPAMHGWLLFKIYLDIIQYQTDFRKIHTSLDRVTHLVKSIHPRPYPIEPFIAPSLPSLVIGREEALNKIKSRLGILPKTTPSSITIVRGWPGVGKTIIVSTLAYDPDIVTKFPDGLLWIALGEKPNLLASLSTWGRALGISDIYNTQDLEDLIARLRGKLLDKRLLLIIDDVWETEHAEPFRVGGPQCATLITTRISKVADDLAPTSDDIYPLPVLTDEKGMELLQTLSPKAVQQHPQKSFELVHDLEGLPLALQVAGRLLRAEAKYGWDITDLLREIRHGAKLLKTKAPPDRIEIAKQTTPTIAVLLQKSTDRLNEETRHCFAFLGAFAPKPATFDLEAMKGVWQVDNPQPIVRTLVERGLLEPVEGRFQMHALLVKHAQSMLIK